MYMNDYKTNEEISSSQEQETPIIDEIQQPTTQDSITAKKPRLRLHKKQQIIAIVVGLLVVCGVAYVLVFNKNEPFVQQTSTTQPASDEATNTPATQPTQTVLNYEDATPIKSDQHLLLNMSIGNDDSTDFKNSIKRLDLSTNKLTDYLETGIQTDTKKHF